MNLDPSYDGQTLAWNDDGDVRMAAKMLAGSNLSYVAVAVSVDSVDYLFWPLKVFVAHELVDVDDKLQLKMMNQMQPQQVEVKIDFS